MTPRQVLSAARICALRRHPYLAPVLVSLRPVEREGLGTLGVDAGWRLHYDPQAVLDWGKDALSGRPPKALAGVLVHETFHILRRHFERIGNRNSVAWNVASDCEINDDVIQAGWEFPTTPVTPSTISQPDGLAAEQYYDSIPRPPDSSRGNGEDSTHGDGGDQDAQGTDGGTGGRDGAVLAPGCGGQCGGCAGNPHKWEEKGKDGKNGSLPDPISKIRAEIAIRQVAHGVREALKGGRSRGTVPAGLQAWAELEIEPSKVDWRRALAAMVRRAAADAAGASDYTWSRPGRRQHALNRVARMSGRRAAVLPALRAPLIDAGLVLDTSGSMVGSPIRAALTEVLGVVRALGVPVTVYATDAEVHAVCMVLGRRDLERVNKGGGGTDMRVGIAEALRTRRHDVVVVLTDGLTPWPEPGESRGVRVVAGIVPGGKAPPGYIPCIQIGE